MFMTKFQRMPLLPSSKIENDVESTESALHCVGKLGDRATSDVIVRLRTVDGRDEWLYSHSRILSSKSKYFATRLSDEWPTYHLLDSRNCVEISCLESDIDHHVTLLRLLYTDCLEPIGDTWYSVNNALGMLRVATKLGCDAIVSKCAQYLEAVPWEENEEEEILKTLPGLGADVVPVLARLQPVNADSVRNVFLSAVQIAILPQQKSSNFPSELKVAAQEQVEYMLVEDDDAPLLKADAYIKSKLRTFFSEVFDSFKLFLGRLLSEADLGSQVSKELLLEKVSDLLWASRILPRVGLNPELVDFWSSASSDVIRVLNSEKLEEVLWDTKLRVVEIAAKVLEAVGYGFVIVKAEERTQLVKVWLPFIRDTTPLFDSLFAAEKMSLQMDTDLCQTIEAALVSLILSLPSGDQADILVDWLKTEQARYPDLSEAFEVWCFRSKAAKRRLNMESTV
ncbi:unnamed protein product [Sphagnum troendelagicum]|uniref:BTB domain-containing protein n=1 Tax=Sphagnum troendelagicum TaxID=128251 RepID=A0ABP0V1E6_9BRYO